MRYRLNKLHGQIKPGHLTTLENNETTRQLIDSLRKSGFKIRLYGRHSNRKGLVGKVYSKPYTFKSGKKKIHVKARKQTHSEIKRNVQIKFAERLAIYVY